MRGSASSRTSITPGGALAGPWVKNELWRRARAVPSLDLRFAENKSLVDATTGSNLVDHTRASSGTYVGSDGLIKTARTNLLLQSEDFSANWTRTGIFAFGSGSVVDATSAPNGSTTADLITEDTSTGRHRVSQGINFVAGVTYTFSIYAKSSTRNIYINFNTAFNASAGFNLSDGSYQINTGSASVASVGNGWYRVSVTGIATATATTSGFVQIQTGLVDENYTGDGTSGIYLWGAQLEQSTTVGEYVKTTSTINSTPRFDHDPTTGESLGLLVEESRTNLVEYSEDFSQWADSNCAIDTDVQTAPDGTLTADKAVPNTNNAPHVRHVSVATTAGVTNTASVYAKAAEYNQIIILLGTGGYGSTVKARYDLTAGTVQITGFGTNTTASIEPVENGWYRCIVSSEGTAASTPQHQIRVLNENGDETYEGDGVKGLYLWGAQIEEGSFPTSYIPTEGTTVTRAADVASISGSNFSSWYRQDAGTVFVDSNSAAANNTRIAAISDNTTASRIILSRGSGSSGNINMSVTDTTVQFSGLVFATALAAGTSNKVAAVYKANDFAGSVNGLTAVTQSTGTVPSAVTQLGVGTGEVLGNNTMTGTIRRLTYWPTRLPNETLQGITQ